MNPKMDNKQDGEYPQREWSANTTDALFQQMQSGNKDARERIIMCHLPYVIWVVKNFFNSDIHEFEDMVQCGSVGLILATETYDPKRGVRLTTYATPFIQKEIRVYLNSIKYPFKNTEHDIKQVTHMKAEFAKAVTDLGKPPSDAQLLQKLQNAYAKDGWTNEKLKKIRMIWNSATENQSQDTNLHDSDSVDDDDSNSLNQCFDPDDPLTQESLRQESLCETVKIAVARLSDEERELVITTNDDESDEENDGAKSPTFDESEKRDLSDEERDREATRRRQEATRRRQIKSRAIKKVKRWIFGEETA